MSDDLTLSELNDATRLVAQSLIDLREQIAELTASSELTRKHGQAVADSVGGRSFAEKLSETADKAIETKMTRLRELEDALSAIGQTILDAANNTHGAAKAIGNERRDLANAAAAFSLKSENLDRLVVRFDTEMTKARRRDWKVFGLAAAFTVFLAFVVGWLGSGYVHDGWNAGELGRVLKGANAERWCNSADGKWTVTTDNSLVCVFYPGR